MAEPLKTAISQSGKHYPLTGNTQRTQPRNHSKDREAREAWFNRKKDRPTQLTSGEIGHVVGYIWIRVSEDTILQVEEMMDEL